MELFSILGDSPQPDGSAMSFGPSIGLTPRGARGRLLRPDSLPANASAMES